MENKKITFGRYKNKTFQEVFDMDKDYCKMVFQNHEAYRGDTGSFREFLETKLGFNGQLEKQLDNKKSNSKNWHESKSIVSTSRFKPTREKLKCPFSKSMFPIAFEEFFESSGNEKSMIEKDCKRLVEVCVTAFLRKFHYKHILEFKNIIGEPNIMYEKVHPKSILMKTNADLGMFYSLFFNKCIYNRKSENAFYIKANEICISFPITIDWNYVEDESVTIEIFEYIISEMLEDLMNYLECHYFKITDIKREIKHFLVQVSNKATEDCDIKRLLSYNYLLSNKVSYTETFKKYFFFYMLCKENEEKDAENKVFNLSYPYPLNKLWKLSESYRIYQFYKGDIFDILEDIFNTGYFNQIYFDHSCDIVKYNPDDIDIESLKYIIIHVEKFEHLETCIIHPSSHGDQFITKEIIREIPVIHVDNCYLIGEVDLLYGTTLIDFTYSFRRKDIIYDYFKLILYAIIFDMPITKLKIYNSCLGEETYMDMIENIEEVKNFIRKYRNPAYLYLYLNDTYGYEPVIFDNSPVGKLQCPFSNVIFPVAHMEYLECSGNEKAFEGTKYDSILSLSVSGFLRKLHYKQVMEFKHIVREVKVMYNKVHPESSLIETNLELQIFYFTFFKKCIYNLKHKNAFVVDYDSLLQSVFPIDLDWNYDQDESININIFQYINEIIDDLQDYMKYNFFKITCLKKEIKHLLVQISLKAKVDSEIKKLLECDYYFTNQVSYILTLKKYMFFYALCKEYDKFSIDFDRDHAKDTSDLDILQHIDEIIKFIEFDYNVTNLKREIKHYLIQLYCNGGDRLITEKLLSYEYFRSDQLSYIEVFRKHFLLYILHKDHINIISNTGDVQSHEIKNNENKDDENLKVEYNLDLLWKLIESYRIYQFNQGNIFDILEHIFNTGMIRLYINNNIICEYKQENINMEHLQHILCYARNVVDTVSIISPTTYLEDFVTEDTNNGGFTIDSAFLYSNANYLAGDTLINIKYSNQRKDSIYDFFKLILCAVMLDVPVKKLMIYNACLGEETYIYMIDNVEEVKAFVKQYRNAEALHKYLHLTYDVKFNILDS